MCKNKRNKNKEESHRAKLNNTRISAQKRNKLWPAKGVPRGPSRGRLTNGNRSYSINLGIKNLYYLQVLERPKVTILVFFSDKNPQHPNAYILNRKKLVRCVSSEESIK